MNAVEKNKELMQSLDDAWNSRDWDTFLKRHAENTVVTWMGKNSVATKGRQAHKEESLEFCKIFPDNHLDNHPYTVLIGQGDWTCSVAKLTGTMKGPMTGPDGKIIPPTNKKFEIEFCTVAHWVNGEIVEEKLFYDLAELMRQIGLMPGAEKKAA